MHTEVVEEFFNVCKCSWLSKSFAWNQLLLQSTSAAIKVSSNTARQWQSLDINTNTFTAVSDRVFIYDSLLSKKIDQDTIKQICSMVRPVSKSLRFEVINMMRQPNTHDCGILSIAFIIDIALGFNPAKSVWDIQNMRSHLISCLEMKKFERFLVLKARRIPFGSRVFHSHVEKINCTTLYVHSGNNLT